MADYTVHVEVRYRWPLRLILWAAPVLRRLPLIRDLVGAFAATFAMRLVLVKVVDHAP